MKKTITKAEAEKILVDSLTEADFGDVIYEAARNLFLGFIDSIHHDYDIEGCDDEGLEGAGGEAWYDDIYDEFSTTAYELMTKFLTQGRPSSLEEIREEAVARIKAVLSECGIKTLTIDDLNTGDSPIVHWGYNEVDVFTLDRITVEHNGELSFDSSSAYSNETNSEGTMETDPLVDIAEFVEKHKDAIKELSEEE